MQVTVKKALMDLARFNGQQGSCWDDPTNLVRLNDARGLIYERGEFTCTTGWVASRLCGKEFCLPIEFEQARTIYACGPNIEVQGQSHLIDRERVQGIYANSPNKHFLMFRESAFKTPLSTARFHKCNLLFTNDNPEDDGEELTIVFSYEGVKYTEKIVLDSKDGTILDGLVDVVISLTKPITKGPVRVDAMRNDVVAESLAVYPAWVENPRFTRYLIECNKPDICIMVYAMRKFRQLTDYEDLLEVESKMAMKAAYEALNYKDAKDNPGFVGEVQIMENFLEKTDGNLILTEPSASPNMEYSFT